MKGKILFVTGAAIGYVLGARAGRKRYEQIRSAADKVWQTPGIQRQVQQVQDYAADKIGDVPGMLVDGAKKAVSGVMKKTQNGGGNGTNVSNSTSASSSGGVSRDEGALPGTVQNPATSDASPTKAGTKKKSSSKSASSSAPTTGSD